MNLGENIYRFRTQLNMSQGDLADALEVSRQSVSKWENNSAVPELDKLMKMAQIFGITLDELVTGEEKEAPTPLSHPAPAPTLIAPPAKEGLSGWKIAGAIMLTCGLLLSIICFLVSILKENTHFEIMFAAIMLVGLPLIVLGIVCLVVKKHTSLVCGWVLYVPLWVLFFFLSTSAPLDTAEGIIALFVLSYGVTLSIGTLVQLWTGKIAVSMVTKIIFSLLIVFSLWAVLGLSTGTRHEQGPVEMQPASDILPKT